MKPEYKKKKKTKRRTQIFVKTCNKSVYISCINRPPGYQPNFLLMDGCAKKK